MLKIIATDEDAYTLFNAQKAYLTPFKKIFFFSFCFIQY